MDIAFVIWLYLWIGALIASGYEVEPPDKVEFVDRLIIATFWLPFVIVGIFTEDS